MKKVVDNVEDQKSPLLKAKYLSHIKGTIQLLQKLNRNPKTCNKWAKNKFNFYRVSRALSKAHLDNASCIVSGGLSNSKIYLSF